MFRIMIAAAFPALLTPSLFAQITVPATTFPVPGDTLLYAIDNSPGGLDIGPVGGPYIWEFPFLDQESTEEVLYEAASLGAAFEDFPTSTVFAPGALQDHYYRSTDQVFEEIGYAGSDPLNLGISLSSPYEPPLPLRRAPMQFIDIHTVETDVSWAFPIGDLADSLVPQIALVDSLRFRIHTSGLDVVDGFGTCIIPGGSFEVLREKKMRETETSIDAYILFLGWLPLSDLISGGSGGLFDAMGRDTTLEYHFFSATEKEEIAIVSLDPSTLLPQRVRFKSLPPMTAIPSVVMSEPAARINPNPSYGQFTLSCKGFLSDQYRFSLVSAEGLPIRDIPLELSGDRDIQIALPDLVAGWYAWSISDRQGRRILDGKLVIQ